MPQHDYPQWKWEEDVRIKHFDLLFRVQILLRFVYELKRRSEDLNSRHALNAYEFLNQCVVNEFGEFLT